MFYLVKYNVFYIYVILENIDNKKNKIILNIFLNVEKL